MFAPAEILPDPRQCSHVVGHEKPGASLTPNLNQHPRRCHLGTRPLLSLGCLPWQRALARVSKLLRLSPQPQADGGLTLVSRSAKLRRMAAARPKGDRCNFIRVPCPPTPGQRRGCHLREANSCQKFKYSSRNLWLILRSRYVQASMASYRPATTNLTSWISIILTVLTRHNNLNLATWFGRILHSQMYLLPTIICGNHSA
ncbi:hypothetical protein B0J13DRAFT_171751 [Dactylonectria estremocensis]|uniref:Uncharacterized protein n=1 Tax=Dactylonectria estremocensis TaxID=1079267 RepID=A0A9P9FCW9_9HYPO|nr:hypothetical protein B0J13DRAFT_171751 [Dactylonectria estremocensis]